jgi:hypothetical protein
MLIMHAEDTGQAGRSAGGSRRRRTYTGPRSGSPARAMNGEYQWWLLAVVAAATLGVIWLLRGTLPRREVDVEQPELAAEARWISRRLQALGGSTPVDTIEQILELHRTYLEEPPPNAPLETVLMPLPEDHAAHDAPVGASDTAGRPGSRRERRRAAQQATSGQAELPTARYRESGSGG